MPIFEYLCLKCGEHFEKLQKAGKEQSAECPKCGSFEVKKELSTFSSCGSTSEASCSSGG